MKRLASVLEGPSLPSVKGTARLPALPLLTYRGAESPLVDRITRALRATGYPPLRTVTVALGKQGVVLQGRVPSYYLKQVAQATVMALPGIGSLVNNLEVTASRPLPGGAPDPVSPETVEETPVQGNQPVGIPATDPFHQGKPGVLVVDDDIMILVMLRVGLEQSGFRVWLANTGREAVDVFKKNQAAIDVVLLDVRMPDLDGPHTLDALRSVKPQVPACFMSGDVGEYDTEKLETYGVQQIFAKPFCLAQVTRTLHAVAGKTNGES